MTKKMLAKAAPAKKPAAKKAPVKKSAAKKAPAKAAPVKKSAVKKSAPKKAPAKAAPVKKSAVKKSAAKKAPAKAAPVKKSAAKKAPAKAAPVKKSATKKAPAKAAAATKPAGAKVVAKKPAVQAASATKTLTGTASAKNPAVTPVASPVLEKAPAASPVLEKAPVAKLERDAHVIEKRAAAPVLRVQPASESIAPRSRTIVAPAASAAPTLPSPLKRARPLHRPDPHGADTFFLAHASAAGLDGASIEMAWARMPLFAPLLALALVRQGADGVVHATIRAAASEVADADIVDALSALSAPSRRAVQTLAEARDEAILARKPARASLLDAIQHALEGALVREEGDAAAAYERGIDVGRALTAAVALGRRLDASEPEQRAEVVRSLHERILGLSPALPGVG